MIWGADDIRALEQFIVEKKILHIDGACARCPKDAEYNRGNVRFELQLFANTEVTILGEHDDVNDLEEVLEMDLCDIIHHENKIIKLHVYLKSKFVYQSVGLRRNLGTYGCGSVTDGSIKLEVRIGNFKNILHFQKDDAITLIGTICTEGARLYLQVNSEEDIFPRDGAPLSKQDVLLGYRELKRINERQIHRDEME